MNMKQKIARKIKQMFDPVCQDPDVVLFGEYKGKTVVLVPVLSPHDPMRIEGWVPDPESVMIIKKKGEQE